MEQKSSSHYHSPGRWWKDCGQKHRSLHEQQNGLSKQYRPDYLHDKTLDYCSGLLSRGCPISMCSLQVYAEEVASRHVRRTDWTYLQPNKISFGWLQKPQYLEICSSETGVCLDLHAQVDLIWDNIRQWTKCTKTTQQPVILNLILPVSIPFITLIDFVHGAEIHILCAGMGSWGRALRLQEMLQTNALFIVLYFIHCAFSFVFDLKSAF